MTKARRNEGKFRQSAEGRRYSTEEWESFDYQGAREIFLEGRETEAPGASPAAGRRSTRTAQGSLHLFI